MPKAIPEPTTAPSALARRLIERILAYPNTTRNPADAVAGLRHIALAAERAWDQSVWQARQDRITWAELMEATGLPLGTLQGRQRLHESRLAQPDQAPPA